MILQSSFKAQVNNLVTLVGASDISTARSLDNVESLQVEYRNFIYKLQSRAKMGASGAVNIITDINEARELRQFFVNDSLLDDMAQAEVILEKSDASAEEKKQLLIRAINEMEIYSMQHRTLFDIIITDIFILPSKLAKAGSTSQAIGVIWANPKIDYTLHDTIEILIHEMTHHSMFIDELRHSHYIYNALLDKDNWAQSAILNAMRPLDKVLHSAVVALEVFLFREKYIGHPTKPRVHPPTKKIISQIKNTISSIEEVVGRSEIFQPRAYELLKNIKDNLKRATS